MNFETYKELLKDMDISITNEQIEQLNTYKEMLKEWNSVMDLTAICDDESIIEKHFYDSLLSYKIVNYDNQSLLDVGTGAGFPGLVLKIVFPSLKVTLLEPTTKRCKFLNAVIEKLKLTDIEVINERAEDFIKKNQREKYDYVTARAVSRLNVLLELVTPFIKVNGIFIALKGKNGNEEILEAKNAIKTLNLSCKEVINVSLPSENEQRVIAIFQKEKETDIKYPRNYGTIKKKPL